VSTTSFVLPPELDRRYPVVVRGDGVRLEDSEAKRYLDAMSGGSMAATLGQGRSDLETHEPLFSGYHIFNSVRNTYVPLIEQIVEQMPASGVDIITANSEDGGSPIGS
jgi:adenosylmethionine-8-amino-7-oxononanoate aminotransferase